MIVTHATSVHRQLKGRGSVMELTVIEVVQRRPMSPETCGHVIRPMHPFGTIKMANTS